MGSESVREERGMTMTTLLTPKKSAILPLHTDAQQDFENRQHYSTATGSIDWEHPQHSGNSDCSHPMPIIFTWESDAAESKFELSEFPDFSCATVRIMADNTVTLENFKIGTRYFWRVNDSEVFDFITEDIAPRWIHCEGPSNIRDMGGWKTKDDRRIKQGLIYRGGEMDSHYKAGADGLRVMREELGIKTDLDLRRGADELFPEHPLGDSVKYILSPVDGYNQYIDQKHECKPVMEVLADESNYPVYFHCHGGADRTGTVAFMLEALLGVEEADLMLDYELTTLSIWGERCRNMEPVQVMLNMLRAYGKEGDDWQTLVENFFRDCGISDETMEKLRANLLE